MILPYIDILWNHFNIITHDIKHFLLRTIYSSFDYSNPSVVSIDAKGVLTGLKEGTSTITVETNNNLSDTCTITVENRNGRITTDEKINDNNSKIVYNGS